MGHSTRRRAGALVLLAGLILVGFASFAGAAGAATAPADNANDNKVCNNQSGDPTKDCQGDKYHGDVTTSFDTDGNLVFSITGVDGFTAGWNDLFICIPGTPRTRSADCQGNTASTLSPTTYDVTTPTPNTEGTKDVTFACSTAVTAVVEASALPAGTFPWTLHLNTCAGGTDEAFGSATRPPAPGQDFTYECLAPTGVTSTGATLNGRTDDDTVTRAVFTVTGGPTVTDSTPTADDNEDLQFSGDVTGLTANTVYTYKVDFYVDGDGAQLVGSATGCQFSTTQAHTYACAAPQNVTQTAARLRGTTDDATVNAAEFTVGDGVTIAGTSDGAGGWYADDSALPAGATTRYTVQFDDGSTPLGSASCEVGTAAVLIPAVEETPPTTAPDVRPTEVAGVEVTRTDPAPAVEGIQLARTGPSHTPELLAAVGALLVLAGAAMTFVRPSGDHYA
ncbi:MAG TPA: hypothetical protein VHN98_08505 [Acidimicrobiales bacterium]|nr:hypothetical protein [Acidimicrobiales bacterium]